MVVFLCNRGVVSNEWEAKVYLISAIISSNKNATEVNYQRMRENRTKKLIRGLKLFLRNRDVLLSFHTTNGWWCLPAWLCGNDSYEHYNKTEGWEDTETTPLCSWTAVVIFYTRWSQSTFQQRVVRSSFTLNPCEELAPGGKNSFL